MDPSTQPYRRSWMPFGRTGRTQPRGVMSRPSSTAPRRRISMTPVQLQQSMESGPVEATAAAAPYGENPAADMAGSASAGPAPRQASAGRPADVYRAATPGLAARRTARPPRQAGSTAATTATLATTTTDGGYPQGVLPAGRSRRQERRRTASSRTARIRTARPTRVGDLVPALRARAAAGDAATQGGATMSAPPPPPTLAMGRGGSTSGGSSAPSTGSRPRPRNASGVPALSFEPLAIGAFFVVFFAPPIALFMAIASLRRAYQKRVSPVLSWIALLVSGFATVISLGIFAAVVDALSGLG